MYLYIITLGLCLSYILFFFALPLFFGQKAPRLNRRSIFSLLLICALSLIIYVVVFNITNVEFGNRILHTFGGGFLAFLSCFLAVKDSQLKINKFQFFVISALLVSALGVTNEIMEFCLQNYLHQIMATSINDTWLDLISNSVGLSLAAILFVPFVNWGAKRENKETISLVEKVPSL